MSETCYGHSSPNAVFLSNYGPCNPQQGGISLCCEIGETCLTNGLCVTPSGVYYNGGCTDITYKAAICPTFCTSGKYRAVDQSLVKLIIGSGDANWVIECHGPAVHDGDFCCSVNGTTTTCCNTASNGLGLVAAVSSAQAVSATFIGASIVPSSTSGGPIASSFGSVTSGFPITCTYTRACMLILGRLSHVYIPSDCHFATPWIRRYAWKQESRNRYRICSRGRDALGRLHLCPAVDQTLHRAPPCTSPGGAYDRRIERST